MDKSLRKKKKIIHMCKVTRNNSATEQLFRSEKGRIKEEDPQHTGFAKN